MRGAVIYEHGELDVIKIVDDLPIPEPGRGEVRVAMQAVALNRLDLWVRQGWPGLKLDFPHVVCADGAGIVDAMGAGVTDFEVGQRVCIDPTIVPAESLALMTGLENQSKHHILGEQISGTAAEQVVVPARNLLRMPDDMPFETSAAAGLVYLTAWHSLMTRGGLRTGETVLIVGAGGGVNLASLQIAKLAGAYVIVVGSTAEKCAKVEALGADFTVSREEEPNWSRVVYSHTSKRGVDVVVDNVGQATLMGSIRSTRIGGRVLIVGNTSGPHVDLDLRYIFTRQVSLIGSTMGPHQDYVKVMSLIHDGKLRPVVGASMPLQDMQGAQRQLAEFEVFGKIVLTLD